MKLFIGNLDDKIQSHHLKEAFSEFGEVSSAKVITEKGSRKSRGFGFVEMPKDAEAKEVINNVNGGTWEGKVLNIREAY